MKASITDLGNKVLSHDKLSYCLSFYECIPHPISFQSMSQDCAVSTPFLKSWCAAVLLRGLQVMGEP